MTGKRTQRRDMRGTRTRRTVMPRKGSTYADRSFVGGWLDRLEERRLLSVDFGPLQTIDNGLFWAQQVTTADLNNDGAPDVIAQGSYRLTTYLNDGSGNFGASPSQIAIDLPSDGSGGGLSNIAGVDVDSDGALDVLVGAYPGAVEWLRNDGTGTLEAPVVIAQSTGDGQATPFGIHSVAGADLNHDGKMDVVGVLYRFEDPRKVFWWENLDGAGTAWQYHLISDDGGIAMGSRSVKIADINADGKPDVVVASRFSNAASWFENVGDGASWTAHVISSGAMPNPDPLYDATTVVPADLNGDGSMDVLASCEDAWYGAGVPHLVWYANDGTGNFGPANVLAGPDWGTTHGPSVADLNNDGRMDVVGVSASLGKVVWFANLGGGVFSAEQLITNDASSSGCTTTADLNGDGDVDVIWVNAVNSQVAWSENQLVETSVVGTTTTVDDGTAVYGDASVTLTAQVAAADATAIGQGAVTFIVSQAGSIVGSVAATVTGGLAAADFALAGIGAGSYAVTASYANTASPVHYAASVSAAASSLTVQKAAPVMTNVTVATITKGESTTLLGGMIAAGTLVPTGTVAVVLNGVTKAASIGADGRFSASFATGALAAGTYAVSCTYAGDADFNAASGTGQLTVTFGVGVLFDNTQAKKSGSTIPVKIAVLNAAGVADRSGVAITATGIASASAPGVMLAPPSPGNSQPENLFKYDSKTGEYQFNLKTTGLYAGTYFLFFQVAGDPVLHSVSFAVR